MYHDNEDWGKIWRGIDLLFQNWHHNLMKICTLMGSFWPKYLFELKSTEELCFMTRNSDAKFDGKLICSFRNDMRNLANFLRLKNSDFILQSKKAELNQIKNSK